MNPDRLAAIAESTPLVRREHEPVVTDQAVLSGYLNHLRVGLDWLEEAAIKREAELPPAVMTRYRDALIVIDEAWQDMACSFCEREPIAVQHPDGDFRCAECAEKVEAQ